MRTLTDADVEAIASRLAQKLRRATDDRPLLSTEAAAERLGVSPRTLRDMFQRGVLPSVKIEGSRRVEPCAIDEYIEANRHHQEAA